MIAQFQADRVIAGLYNRQSSESDFWIIRRCRGDHSRLSYALMLCYLRHRRLHVNERTPIALVSFVAAQMEVSPKAFNGYLSTRSKTAAVTRRSFRTGYVFVPSARSPLQSWRTGCCHTPLRMTGWLIWRI
jgi:hypothetical protein